jgi:PTH1 family peptidyl-tRNA hydrolase
MMVPSAGGDARASLPELVVFLGNPGGEYKRNRHNAGRLLAERLPFYGGLSWQKKFKGLYAAPEKSGLSSSANSEGRVHFLMPETYMNLSGDSVLAASSFFKIAPENIIAVHDELELPLGTVSFKFSGGLGGHNGLRSMKQKLGTADFWRLRIGIGRPAGRLPGEGGPPGSGGDVSGWVLSDFGAGELPLLETTLTAAAGALTDALLSGPEKMLPEWAKKRIINACD